VAPPLEGTALIQPPSLREQIYARIQDSILTGELKSGARLSPAALAESFGVSTMPVREALRLLEDDGLIETAPRRWTRVAYPDPGLADDVYPLLAVLEEYALRTAPAVPLAALTEARRANAELEQAAAEHDVLACVAADVRFHSALVSSHVNAALLDMIDGLKMRIRLLEGSFFQVDDAKISIGQHAKVVEALAAGDGAAAGAAVAANWHHGLRRLREVLGSEGLPGG
jgi:DNA-binding GntR family transcriptional regulator